MAVSRFFERRALRTQLKTYLDARGWTDLTWSEGFSALELETIEPPFISVILEDLGRQTLEMGGDPQTNQLISRRAQIDVYMESADRADALVDLISDFMDTEVLIIKDNNNVTLGSMISLTESILSVSIPPDLEEEKNLEWHSVASCMYEAHYP